MHLLVCNKLRFLNKCFMVSDISVMCKLRYTFYEVCWFLFSEGYIIACMVECQGISPVVLSTLLNYGRRSEGQTFTELNACWDFSVCESVFHWHTCPTFKVFFSLLLYKIYILFICFIYFVVVSYLKMLSLAYDKQCPDVSDGLFFGKV